MGYTAGETITAAQYNIFVNNSSSPYGYNHFAGTGSLEYGLGLTGLATETTGATITAAQWNSLFTAMANIANHTNDTLTSTGAVTTGDTIAIKAALEADIATLAASVAAGCPNATALTTSSALQTVTTASEGWDNSATQEVSVTFSNADEMRYFFNAGGKIRITVGATASSVSAKDTAFVALGTGLGNIDIGSQSTTRSGDSQTLTTDGLSNGFYDLSTSYTTLIKLTQVSYAAYNSNSVEISAKLDAAPGSAVTMTIKMVALDPADDSQYSATNFDGVPADINNTPKMVTTLYTITPNTSEGLSTAYGIASSATVSNTTT